MELEPRKPTVKGPPEWFTGDVYIDAVARGHGASPLTIGLVHFTPGARTAWHSHSLGQTLYVTEGQGRVQTRGELIVTIGPGDVVFTPGDEWHWHGAAPDHVHDPPRCQRRQRRVERPRHRRRVRRLRVGLDPSSCRSTRSRVAPTHPWGRDRRGDSGRLPPLGMPGPDQAE